MLGLLLSLFICGKVWALPTPRNRVTLSVKDADLVCVLRVIAEQAGGKLWVDSTVQGSVTAELYDLSSAGAVRLVLAQQTQNYEFGFRKNGSGPCFLIVGAPGVLSVKEAESALPRVPPGAMRMEYILEDVPSEKALDYFRSAHPDVEFIPHDTLNGFYARGSREDLLQIKRVLLARDRVSGPDSPPLVEFLSVRNGDISEVRKLLMTLIPYVRYDIDTRLNLIRAEGSLGAIDQVREVLAELNCPSPDRRTPVTLSFKDADLVLVLRTLANDMGMGIYVGPTVYGSVTLDLVEIPAEEALQQVLAAQENEYDFMIFDVAPRGKNIVVAPPDKLLEIKAEIDYSYRAARRLVPATAVRMEYLLDHAPAAKVVDLLKLRYANVEFTPHPTANGFYARGSREDLLRIKREKPLFDRRPLTRQAPQ